MLDSEQKGISFYEWLLWRSFPQQLTNKFGLKLMCNYFVFAYDILSL